MRDPTLPERAMARYRREVRRVYSHLRQLGTSGLVVPALMAFRQARAAVEHADSSYSASLRRELADTCPSGTHTAGNCPVGRPCPRPSTPSTGRHL